MPSVHQVCDYIIMMLSEGNERPNLLKLQKLLYYVQAWYLAFNSKPLFNGKFQAWIHGPVNRQIYDRFVEHKSLYDTVDKDDIKPDFNINSLSISQKSHINAVLEVYAKYSGSQLEEMSHKETPWITARAGYSPTQRCENEIDEQLIEKYFKKRLSKN